MTDAAALPLDELVAGLAVDVPDFPEPGVLFRDLTPVFADGAAFRRVVDGLAAPSLSDPRAAASRNPRASTPTTTSNPGSPAGCMPPSASGC